MQKQNIMSWQLQLYYMLPAPKPKFCIPSTQ